MLKIVYFYQAPLLRIAAGTASPFITSRPMTTVKAAFFSLSTTIQMIATSEIRISVSKYWILSIINQALSKTKELPEIESRYFASEEESHLTSIIYKCHIQPSGNARRVCNMFNELAYLFRPML